MYLRSCIHSQFLLSVVAAQNRNVIKLYNFSEQTTATCPFNLAYISMYMYVLFLNTHKWPSYRTKNVVFCAILYASWFNRIISSIRSFLVVFFIYKIPYYTSWLSKKTYPHVSISTLYFGMPPSIAKALIQHSTILSIEQTLIPLLWYHLRWGKFRKIHIHLWMQCNLREKI